jgi:hypothetical protein
VDYTVTFSEPVTGVDVADFALTLTGGITNPSVASVASVSATTYTVTVNTGSGSGTLRLDVIANASIADLVGNGFGSLAFTGGEVYDIDKTAPTVVSIVRASPNPTGAPSANYTVTFSEPVTGVDVADFALTLTGGMSGVSVTSVSGSGTTYTVVFNTSPSRGTLRLDVPVNASIADLVGNPISGLPFTSGEVYTIFPIRGVGIYDDADNSWVYSAGWSALTGQNGAYKNTDHRTSTRNATALFGFQAPAFFTYYYRTGPSRGSFEIWVDGVKLTTVNANSNNTVWQAKYVSPAFTDNNSHTVMIKNITTNGNYIDADAFEITSAPAAAGAGTYDDADPLWIYSSGWTTSARAGAYGGTLHSTSTNGASATFVFQAPAQFDFYYRTGPNRGSFQVWVDGVRVITINAFSNTTTWQKIYTSPAYNDNKSHTVVIKNISPNGTVIDVDAIKIR